MKATVECIPCYLKQAISAMRVAGISDSRQQTLLKALFPVISTLESSKTPAENSSLVLFELYRLLGMEDPFKEAKAYTNRLAKTFIPALEKVIAISDDPLLTALKASVAGNVIDMGIMPGFNIEASIQEELSRDFERSDYQFFRELLREGKPLVVIGDNSGEIFFDLLLLEQLRNFTDDVTYVVKGGPILNDATLEDAKAAGIDLIAKVVTTGNNYLG
ncbi:MAG: damage-control phosphatase ARMT1 family protein, partial [Thermacetogeniaceae bacterium]